MKIDDLYPLSPLQRGMLFECLLQPGSGDYVVQLHARIQGALDEERLWDAWEAVVARQPILRTAFAWEELEQPLQAVHAEVEVAREQLDWRSATPGEQADRLKQWLDADRGRGYALDRAPLTRLALAREEESAWRLLWSHHHLLLDGWSVPLVLRDLFACYAALVAGQPLPPLETRPFRDYIAWLLDRREDGGAETYWQTALAGMPEESLLPTVSSAPVARELTLSHDGAQRLEAFARERRLTINLLIQTAVAASLAAEFSRGDFPLGVTLSGRSAPIAGIERIVGPLINTVPARVRLCGDESIAAWLARNQDEAAARLAFEHSPQADIHRWLGRSSATPLFECLFAFENFPLDQAAVGIPSAGLEISEVADQGRTHYPLTIVAEPGPPLRLHLLSRTAGCDAAAAERVLSGVESFLNVLLERPDEKLAELPHLQAALADVAANKLLPIIPPASAPAQASSESLRDETERRLAELWEEVLGVAKVGPTDHFFELGGHSLAALRLGWKIKQAFGQSLPLRVLLERPVLREMADLLRAVEADEVETTEPGNGPEVAAEAESAPLSFAQERLWLADQMQPGGSQYHIAGAATIQGPLDVDRLRAAVREVVARQGALRTIFPVEQGQPVQRILPALELEIPCVDLSSESPSQQAAEWLRIERETAAAPFNLTAGPLLRLTLARVGAAEHRLAWAFHHIIADAWSLGLFLGELTASYRSPERPLPPVETSYAAWSRKQRERFAADSADLDWWRDELASAPREPLALPCDHPRPAKPSGAGGTTPIHLPADALASLRRLSQDAGATLYMTLLTAWQATLAELSGQDQLRVGAPVAGRDVPETQSLIGFFVNLLAVRCDLRGDPSFRELLAQTRRRCLDAFARQSVPWNLVARETGLAPPSVVLVLQERAIGRQALDADLTLTVEMAPVDTARCDLSLNLVEDADRLTGMLVYDGDLFEAATAQRIAAAFERCLRTFANAPDTRLSDLKPAPSQPPVVRATGADRPWLLHELIHTQAEKTPAAVALIDDAKRLTYAEMGSEANRLADRLRSLGAGPGRCVAVQLPRGVDLGVALLAVLESGAAYLPLDPELPLARREQLLAAARPVAIVEPAGPRQLRESPPSTATPTPRDLAYVIFTSGSTGRPKGVQIPHRSIVETLRWRQQRFPLTPSDRVVHGLSFAFDASVWELFGPLWTGAAVLFPQPGGHRDLPYLGARIAAEQATHWQLTPSLLRLLVEERDLSQFASLRRIFCGGEPLPIPLAEQLTARLEVELVNLYGPTETAVDATAWVFDPLLPCDEAIAPLGQAITGKRLYVLDPSGRDEQLPAGTVGELCIAGAGLARGYLGRPELTAAAFTPDPHSRRPGARMYRSGDLARWLPTGELAFAGRRDHQVKIRGHRVELGEIESALTDLPGVAEAAARLWRLDGVERLAAYVTPENGKPLDAAALRRRLADRLPEYMLPASISAVASLPRNVHGKLDRAALPEPQTPSAPTATQSPPRTPLERKLAELWLEVLPLAAIGVDDDFFEVGGDSIQGVLLVNQLQERLGEYVWPMALFDSRTIAKLAAHLSGRYPEGIARWLGQPLEMAPPAATDEEPAVTEEDLAELRRLVRVLPPLETKAPPAPRPLGLILSPPRSGSTLLRVMLGGHPSIFAPPELQLLNYRTLSERRAAFDRDRDRFWLDGLVRAVMEVCHTDFEDAQALLAEREAEGEPIAETIQWLQLLLGSRWFVDKTPNYALDPAVLQRVEEEFPNARYLHLVRDPRAAIHSFEKARLEQFYPPFFSGDPPWSSRRLAELIWTASHEHIRDFLTTIEPERQLRLTYEVLVQDPRAAMEQAAAWLGLPFDAEMLEPYRERRQRMTDPAHRLARMLGDVRFHEHQGIDAENADRWRTQTPLRLGEPTRRMAHELGYRIEPSEPSESKPAGERIPAGPRPDALPLSFSQERLWFLQQLAPTTAAYHMHTLLEVHGPLDLPALRRSLAWLIDRHEALRTIFPSVNGRPRQEILAAAAAPLEVVDLRSGPTHRNGSHRTETSPGDPLDDLALDPALVEPVQSFFRQPFDLAVGPLVRFRLYRLPAHEKSRHGVNGNGRPAPERWLWQIVMHHIISDGWSMGVLMREWAERYRAACDEEEPDVAPPAIQFADYALWQRGPHRAETVERQLDWWAAELAGAPAALALPTDYPRPPQPTYRGATLPLTLPASLAGQLKQLGRDERTTLYATLLALWQTLLHQLSEQTTVVVGSPAAGRSHAELADVVGFFVNTLAVRADFQPGQTFRETLAQVRDRTLAAFAHQEAPFERVVERVETERDPSRAPIFQAMFSLQNLPLPDASATGLSLHQRYLDGGVSKFDLTLGLQEDGNQIVGGFEYSVDLFRRRTIERIGRWLLRLARRVVKNPDAPLESLRPFSEKTRAKLAERRRQAEAPPGDSSAGMLARTNLTRNQFLFWCSQALEPNKPIHHLSGYFEARGPIDEEVWREAWRRTVMTTDACRIVFRPVRGAPRQIVLDHPPRELIVVDFREHADPRGAARRWMRRRARLRFPLDRYVCEAALLRLTEDESLMYLRAHHIVFDGWSSEVLFDRFDLCYDSVVRGLPTPGEDWPQLMDAVRREREFRRTRRYQRAEEHWRHKLAQPRERVELAGKQTSDDLRVARVVRRLSNDQAETLKRFIDQHLPGNDAAGAFITLTALYAALIHRLTGSRRFAICSPIHNRRTDEDKKTIGPLMHGLPILMEVEREATLAELVSQVRHELFSAARWGQYSVASPLREPVYDVFVNYHREKICSAGPLAIEDVQWVHPGSDVFIAGLQVHDLTGAGRLELAFEFRAAAFPKRRRRAFAQRMLQMLEQWLAEPERRLVDLPTLLPRERERLLGRFSPAAPPAMTHETLIHKIQRHVAEQPAEEAVVCDPQRLSYGELWQRAEVIAAGLAQAGCARGELVGVCLERTANLPAALLGVWLAGAAYVPLDPRQPEQRLAEMLADAGATLVIGSADGPRSATPGCRRLNLDDLLATEEPKRPAVAIDRGDLAYVIFTSGSTGRPKGVAVSHGALADTTAGWLQEYGLDHFCGRHLQLASVAFDVFTGDLARAWGSGGTLVICPRERLLDPPALLDLIERERIDCGEFTPGVLRPLLDHLEETGKRLDRLRVLIAGSDVWRWEEHQRLARLAGPATRTINSYGVTECTIDSTYFEHSDERIAAGDTTPIGRPFPQAVVRVLTPELELAPIGTPGELYLGGSGLARGYWRRPTGTAAAFVPDPTGGTGARLYRTGDRAMWLDDGNLAFLGRADRQIKIRGYRVEPGEVERITAEHPQIREAAVTTATRVRDSAPTLVAYFTADKPLDRGSLRQDLAGRLPDYMIPPLLMQLDALPLSPNGKVDRRALPTPDWSQLAAEDRFTPPRDQEERRLVDLWQQTLRLPKIGVHDNFFEIGGNSLAGIELMTRIQQAGLPLAPKDLFEAPTIAQQAAALARRQREKTGSGSVRGGLRSLRSRGPRPPLVLIHPIEGRVDAYRPLAKLLGGEQPVWAFESPALAELSTTHAPTSVSELARQYAAEIEVRLGDAPLQLGGWSFGGVVAQEIARQRRAAGREIAGLTLIDAFPPAALPTFDETLAAQCPNWRPQPGETFDELFARLLGRIESLPRELLVTLATQFGADGESVASVSSTHVTSLAPWLRLLLGHAWSLERHVPQPFTGSTLLLVSETSLTRRPEAAAAWRSLCGEFKMIPVPGDHRSLLQPPQVAELAAAWTHWAVGAPESAALTARCHGGRY